MDFSAALFASTSKTPRKPAPGRRSASGSGEDASPESGTGEGKKRDRLLRVVRACDACRKRKSRCSGGQPCAVCVASAKGAVQCSYEPPKRGPPKTWLEALEQRLEAMESLLRTISDSAGLDLGSLLDTVDGDEKTLALEKAVELLEERRRAEGQLKAEGERAASAILPDSFQGCLLEGSHTMEKDRFVGSSSSPAFAKNILAKIAPLPAGGCPSLEQDHAPSLVDVMIQGDHAAQAKAFPLPPPDLSAALILAYFDHINSIIPLLHRPSFERAIQAGMLETDPSFRRLVLSIFALGARFVDDPRLPTPERVRAAADPKTQAHAAGFTFFRAASGEISANLVTSSLFDIQSSVLCVIWLLGATNPLVSWQRVGWAIRRAVDVGSHSEHRTRWTLSPLEDQLRKRAFHSLFAIDRTLSAQLGRPLAMQDWELDLLMPLDVSDEALDEWDLRGSMSAPPPPSSTPTPLAGWICYLQILKIDARTIRTLYRTTYVAESASDIAGAVSDLDSSLNEWLSTVPDHLRWNPNMDPKWMVQSALLHCALYYSQILIHRDFMASRGVSTLPSMAICANAARASIHVLEHIQKGGKLQDTFWFAPLHLACAGMILTILLIRRGPDAMSPTSGASADSNLSLDIIRGLGSSTLMAYKIEIALSKLLAIAATHNQRVQQAAKPPLPLVSPAATGGIPTKPQCVPYSDPILAMSPLAEFSSASSPSAPSASSSGYFTSPSPPTAEGAFDFGTFDNSTTAGYFLSADPTLLLPSQTTPFLPWDNTELSMLDSTHELDWVSNFGTSFDMEFLNHTLGTAPPAWGPGS